MRQAAVDDNVKMKSRLFIVGMLHSIIQVIGILYITKGDGVYLLLSLSELSGQVEFIAWFVLNFIVIAYLLHSVTRLISSWTVSYIEYLLNITFIPIVGAITSAALNQFCWLVHCKYINQVFRFSDFIQDSLDIGTYTLVLVLIGELINLTPILFTRIKTLIRK